MKKFLIILLFLVVLGIAGFFLGWAQLTVPPGSFGVMRSKTHGLDAQVIRDGEFRWIWYKLIPTNAEISVYTIDQVRRPIRSSGSLPSGQIFAELAGIEADFSWEITGELSFNIRPDALPEFTARHHVNDNAGLRRAEEDLAVRIEQLVIDRLRTLVNNENDELIESLLIAGTIPELEREIQRAFPEIENLNSTIRTIRYPDFVLYRSLRELYRQYIDWQNFILSDDILREAERRIQTRMRMEELRLYGELLTRFPVLLDFLALEQRFITRSE